MMAARSLLWLVSTLAVVATLWMTLLSGGGGHTTSAPTGPTSYGGAVNQAQSAVQQASQDAQRAAGSSAGDR